jgi:hypothetical protein
MPNVYQVKARATDVTLETVVEVADSRAQTQLGFEAQARSFAYEAILIRWRELCPEGSLDLVLDLSVQRLPDTETESVYPGLGPYHLGAGVRVWITDAPRSWGGLPWASSDSEIVKIIVNNPFWYLCDMAPGCLCSYIASANMPKYVIVPSVGGRAVLDIWSEDPNEEKQTITFESVDGGNAITEAMRFAERYDAEHSKS